MNKEENKHCHYACAHGDVHAQRTNNTPHHHAHSKHHHAHTHAHCACCSEDNGHEHAHSDARGAWRHLLPMAVSAFLLAWGMLANPLPRAEWAIFVTAYLLVGLPIMRQAFHAMRDGDVANEFTLMLLATVGAFCIGEYPEAVAVVLLYSIGEFFQARAVWRARTDIRALVSMHPDTATILLPDGARRNVPPEEVIPGQTIEVRTGERVPLDGVLVDGEAGFDTAALTGEPLPRRIAAGCEVSAGMIATDRVVRISVTRPYADSALQRILQMVEEAARRKSPAEQFIRRFARIYTPVVVVLAAVIALLPPLISGGMWSEWLYRALVFLVISCPCALVVSIPLSYFRGIGVASRRGILFKGGNYLDAVTRLRTVVFDKTGTVTEGRFSLRTLRVAEGFDEAEVLRCVVAVERGSTHPLAQAIVREAARRGQNNVDNAVAVSETAGLGLTGMVNGRRVMVGKSDLLTQSGVQVPSGTEGTSATTAGLSVAETFVYCAIDGRFAGVLSLSDAPKPDADAAISALRRMGIRHIALLSGDRHAVTEAMGRKLHIDECHGDLLPADKARLFSDIRLRNPDRKSVV